MATTTVYVILEAWAGDVPEPIAVCATEASADAYIAKAMKDADDYTHSHRHLLVKTFELLP